MRILRTSPITGKEVVLDIAVTGQQIRDWRSGTLIQDAMPNLTPDEREFIMTGMTQQDWDDIYPPEETT